MMNKQKKVAKTTIFVKLLLVLLICGGTITASVGLIFFLAEFTGWYIICYGLIIAIVRTEFVCIWGMDNIKAEKRGRCNRKKYRRTQMG